MAEDVAEFQAALARQPTEIQQAARRRIGSWPLKLRGLFGYRIPESRFLLRIGTRMFLNWFCYWGDAQGFNNIHEAAQLLPKKGPLSSRKAKPAIGTAAKLPANA